MYCEPFVLRQRTQCAVSKHEQSSWLSVIHLPLETALCASSGRTARFFGHGLRFKSINLTVSFPRRREPLLILLLSPIQIE